MTATPANSAVCYKARFIIERRRQCFVGGLLHGVPDDDDMPQGSEKVLEALRECVHESRPGGRVDAVDQLSETLSLYTGLRLE